MDARTLAEQERFAKWWLDVDDEPMMWIDGKPVDDDLWDLWEAFQSGAESHSWIKITDDPQTLPKDEQLYEFVIGPNIIGIGFCRHGLWLVPDHHEENDLREVHGVNYWREIGELPAPPPES